MDLVTLITACALTVDPKLMHAIVWHQSGGEPWAISVQGDANPHVYRNMRDAIQEARDRSSTDVVRVGLAGISVPPVKVSASVLLPCRNVAMAAVQISRNTTRCKTHPRLKNDPTFCAVAVYRGSWTQPDAKFATDVAATVAKGDAPNFDMPRGTSVEIFDIAEELPNDAAPLVVDVTTTFAEQARSWSSALYPTTREALPSNSSDNEGAPSSKEAPSLTPKPVDRKPQGRGLFVRRSTNELSNDADRRPSSERTSAHK